MDKEVKENGTSLAHFIWEGACGMVLEPKKSKDGEYFWTYRFKRAYMAEETDEWKYADTFTERNDEAIGKLMALCIRFRDEHDASAWVRARMATATSQAA